MKNDPATANAAWSQVRRNDKMAERLARHIVNDIISRNLSSGTMLPAESEMLVEYDVSRGTLREALRLLEAQGLIQVKPGPRGGPMIAELIPADFANMLKFHCCVRGTTYREILDARLAIEPMMARLAAEAQDPVGIESLRAAIKACEQSDLDNEEEWLTTSDQFHHAVASMSGNSLLNLLGASLKLIYRDWATRTITPRKMRANVLKVHQEIADAIFRGDGAEAGRLMSDHMAYFGKRTGDVNVDTLDTRINWA